jgi:hypothetical protein
VQVGLKVWNYGKEKVSICAWRSELGPLIRVSSLREDKFETMEQSKLSPWLEKYHTIDAGDLAFFLVENPPGNQGLKTQENLMFETILKEQEGKIFVEVVFKEEVLRDRFARLAVISSLRVKVGEEEEKHSGVIVLNESML